MSYENETKKLLGYFNSERGQVMVNAIFEKRSVYSRVGDNRMEFMLATAIEFYCNGAEIRIRASDVYAFMGLLNGYTKEFCRSRNHIMRQLEKLGITVEGA